VFECGGDAIEDECGVCNGDNSSCSGCIDDTANNYDSDATIDDGSCTYDHFYLDLSETGVSQAVIFSETIAGLDPGDELGIFDAQALLSDGDCSSDYGSLLVGRATWTGEQINTVAISSIDFCNFPDGYQLPGFVEGNPIIIKVFDASEGVEYDTILDITAGSSDFEETSFVVISGLSLVTYGCIDAAACNYDSNANADDGSCEYAEENYDCAGDCIVDEDCAGDCGGDAYVDDCGECVDPGDSDCVTEVENIIPLSSNWNWISFNVYQDDMSLANVFSSIAIPNDGIDNVSFIKSQLDGTATWYETFGWFGALANTVLDNTQFYQVQMSNPAVLTFSGTAAIPSQTPIELASNWNWIGYVPQESMSLATAFASIAIPNDGIDNVRFIKSQLDGTATWYETFGWFGALANTVLDNTQFYQVQMSNPAVLTFSGTAAIPSQTPIELASNWNWIGYVPQESMSLATAFASIAIPNDGIDNVNFIKSQLDGTATWYETFGWFGALANTTLDPNKGYQLKMNNSALFFYPDEALAASIDDNSTSDDNNLERNNIQDLLGWTFNPREYEFNGTITFAVDNFDDSEGDLLAAFVDGELRGVTECVYFPFDDTYIYIMQVYSNELSGEELNGK
jgi:hypothetical protein